MTTAVDLDERDLGTAVASGGVNRWTAGAGESSTGAGQPFSSRHRAAIAGAATMSLGPPRPTIGATVERHHVIGGAMDLQDRDRLRRGARKPGAERAGNRRDGGENIRAFAASRLAMNAPADIPVAKTRPRSMPKSWDEAIGERHEEAHIVDTLAVGD